MTRKQALEAAIRLLAETGQTEETAVLHTIMEELPLNRWTDEAILDSVEQLILDHGRVPTVSDFKKRCIPGPELPGPFGYERKIPRRSDGGFCAGLSVPAAKKRRGIQPKKDARLAVLVHGRRV